MRRGIFVLVSLLACTETGVNNEPPLLAPGIDAAVSSTNPIPGLARALALASADEDVRRALIAMARTSSNQQISLSRYLQGELGALTVNRMAAQLGLSGSQLRGILSQSNEIEFIIPLDLQRRLWSSEQPLVVTFLETLEPFSSQPDFLPAYDQTGSLIRIPVEGIHERVVLQITPLRSTADYGTLRSNFIPAYAVCDPEDPSCTGDGEPPPPPSEPSQPQGYDLGFTWTDCYSGTLLPADDYDYDGFSNACENALALAFSPTLVFHQVEGHYQKFSHFAVERHPTPDNKVRVFYLLALFTDDNPVYHHGDSEFVELVIEYQNGRWVLESALMSAHWQSIWFPGGGDWTETASWDRLQYVDQPRGRPYVFVSNDHHAMYRSKSRCDDRVADECSTISDGIVIGTYVPPETNIGNGREIAIPGISFGYVGRLIDCTGAPARPGQECFWTGDTFAGWWGSGGTTPYRRAMYYFGWGGLP